MTKAIFKKRFKSAEYSGQTKTFYVAESDYAAAIKFIMHKMAAFKVAIQI